MSKNVCLREQSLPSPKQSRKAEFGLESGIKHYLLSRKNRLFFSDKKDDFQPSEKLNFDVI
jgi:hypothetical protein